MLRLVLLCAAIVATAVADVPYYPCKNVNINAMSTLDLVKYSGTWYSVAMAFDADKNMPSPREEQKRIKAINGCNRSRLALYNANILNITLDAVFRSNISDKSVYPPDAQYTSDKEVRYSVPTHSASPAELDSTHWIMKHESKNSTYSFDFYTLATDYNNWSAWYACGKPPNQPKLELWGLWSRSPKTVNFFEKQGFKMLARVAGVPIATNYLYDFPQDMCF